ncbi:serine hydrolase [Patescibacteria group bacterium]|nr:serine hydrolase [Patescibacteria group bacterium]
MTIAKRKIILAIVLFSALFLFLNFFNSENKEEKNETELLTEEVKTPAFENLKLEAKSAYVFDVIQDKPLFEFNADAQLPLASLTKLMTAVVAKENIPEWMLIDINNEAIKEVGDNGFLVGEKWRIDKLIDAMLISSSNDAATAIALSNDNFISLMNEKSSRLNLVQTYFLNPTGLDSNGQIAGSYGSAKDIAMLMNYLIKNFPLLLEATSYEEIEINNRKFKNTDKLIGEIPGVVASKTGFSDLAGGNLAVVFDIGLQYPIIIVVLGSTEEGRFEDVKNLYNESVKFLIDTVY